MRFRFIRNPEVHYVLWPGLVIALIMMHILNHLLRDTEKRVLILSVVAISFSLITIIFLVVSHRHALHVRKFSSMIDTNLHGHRNLQFDNFKEGDFALLQTSILDMLTVHFRQEEALESEKQLLSNWLENVSHQIKTPLSNITLIADTLARNDVDEMERAMLIPEMLTSISRINDLVRVLLKVARLDANAVQFKKDKILASELIDEACRPLEIAMELRDVRLEKNVPEGAVVWGDKLWLTEAIGNIVKNCMEYSPGGTIRIDVTYSVSSTLIEIRDNGTGIDPEELPHIFERYHKGKNSSANNAGIGLNFTEKVIHGHDGTIVAKNNEDEGVCFTIRLIHKNI